MPPFAATSNFHNFRRTAIVTYVISDIALIGAAVLWLVGDRLLAGLVFLIGLVFTVVALRAAQIVFIRSQIVDRIDRGQTIVAELAGRRHVRASWFRSPWYVVLTDHYLYAFLVTVRPSDARVRVAHGDIMGFRLGTGMKATTVIVDLPSDSIEIVGITSEQLHWFEAELAAKRPDLVRESVADKFDEITELS